MRTTGPKTRVYFIYIGVEVLVRQTGDKSRRLPVYDAFSLAIGKDEAVTVYAFTSAVNVNL